VVLPHIPLHLIQRGNNRQVCFVADEDYRFYLDWLKELAGKTGCRVHAYVLMTNHVHLLLSTDRGEAPGALMKALGQRYVQYFNRTYRRSGTLWEGRYRSCLTQAENYLLACQRYIELNPVRAGMVAHPADYPWSSYRANAQGAEDVLVTPHEIYLALGSTAEQRQATYRDLFRSELEPGLVDQIRQASNGNFALGSARFAKTKGHPLCFYVTPIIRYNFSIVPPPAFGDRHAHHQHVLRNSHQSLFL
jgi:putative transposase